MTHTEWEVRTANGTVIADGKLGDYAEVTRGDRETFEFVFFGAGSVSSGEYRGAEGYDLLRQHIEYSGGVKSATDINGAAVYRERSPAIDPVDSHLVEIAPPGNVSSHASLWAAIVGGDDATPTAPAARARLSIEAVVLADGTDYADRTAAQDALEA